ncbi:PP2C family serine/threonine-protein phosphatase [Longimicrobium sp.]|uniref:PP2C family protein-serine/threonine phosphatase n=1 Tax=Longimicrobium sp. TaxID=2029185 RepID=UPI002EDA20BE
MKLAWKAAGGTDVGRMRRGNEDTFVVDSERGLFLVADGMGGHAAGEIASALAAEAVGGALREGIDRGLQADELAQVMVESFGAADRAIGEHVEAHPATHGMGTTTTACVLCTDGTYRIGHVGDSRAYLLRGDALAQVTKDHTWVQREVDEGRLTPAGARRHRLSHILTRALGTGPFDVPPDLLGGELRPGDLLMLCSDGLTGMLSDRQLGRILSIPSTPEEHVERLIRAANARGGRDNITAVVVEILPATDAAPENG